MYMFVILARWRACVCVCVVTQLKLRVFIAYVEMMPHIITQCLNISAGRVFTYPYLIRIASCFLELVRNFKYLKKNVM